MSRTVAQKSAGCVRKQIKSPVYCYFVARTLIMLIEEQHSEAKSESIRAFEESARRLLFMAEFQP